MARVLLLEDEADLRNEVADFLQSEGYGVTEAGSVADFMRQVDLADIAIIDAGLPDGNGFDVTEQLRRTHPHIGTIMLTARGSIDDKIDGLRRGADHYLIKPIRLRELSAYVSSVKRRLGKETWRLHLLERRLYAPDGRFNEVNTMEIVLLQLLARNMGQVVQRPQIARAFGVEWIDYDERRLDQMISRLRRRWHNLTGEKLPLRTEHGQGYSFCENINVVE
ncbi:response regulator transcription factor [Herbaspirillum sp. RV1423]|uniref:response regulator transcription factor n=1 Tax=Herbaspirillum sp. RV1423 TaxID=1443993 RepID=UPI000558563A|nr:response regulator transcription factor [Herbaspirillum sp. RV1423]